MYMHIGKSVSLGYVDIVCICVCVCVCVCMCVCMLMNVHVIPLEKRVL